MKVGLEAEDSFGNEEVDYHAGDVDNRGDRWRGYDCGVDLCRASCDR